MKTTLFLLLLPLFAHAHADRRLSDLAPDSEFLVNLNDPELLGQRERKWQEGTAENGLRCSLEIQSHFDREAAEKSGPTVYRLTQINPGDSYSVRNLEGRDQASLWLTTENKDLPYLSFDCFRIYKTHKARRSPITLGAVVALVGMPDLFHRPILGKVPSLSAEQFFPDFTQHSRIRMLQALEFQGVNAERDSVSIIEPRIQFGKVVEKFEKGSNCRMGYRHPRMENYKKIAPAGLELRVTSMTGLSKHDGTQLFTLYLETADNQADDFQLTCFSGREFFKDFYEFEGHYRSIVEFVP
jgi:hypothetical protein